LITRRRFGAIFAVGILAASLCLAQTAELNTAQKEEFLLTAKVIKSKTLSEGTTASLRATLSDGQVTHDASVQPIDEFKQVFTSALGTEFNFKDTYKANVAAYRLGKMLGLEKMIPPSVERRVLGNTSAVTWWADDVLMTEKQRFLTKKQPPNPDNWNRQMFIVRVFDQLIYNMDRNLGNLVIDKSWKVQMIDHTRAFRLHKKLKSPENLTRCDRKLFTALQALDETGMQRELSSVLTKGEINAVLARRDRMVALFKGKAAKNGDASVFYDYLSTLD